MKKTLAAVAVLGAFAASASADVTVYGRLDTGVAFDKNKTEFVTANKAYAASTLAKTDSTSMDSGNYTGSRLGFKGTEKISDDLTVGFVLEGNLYGDTGESKLFKREAIVFADTQFGKVAAGHMGTLWSDAGSFGVHCGVFVDGSGHSGLENNAWGMMQLAESRYSNMVAYASPKFGGAQFFAQYGMGAEGEENKSSSDRYAAVAAQYTAGALKLSAVVENINEAGSDDVEDTLSVSAIATYDFGVTKVSVAGQYFKDANDVADGVAMLNEAMGDKWTYTMDQLDGFGVALGAATPLLGGTLYTSVGYVDADGKGMGSWAMADKITINFANEQVDVKAVNFGANFKYPLSKRTYVYTGAGYTKLETETQFGKAEENTWAAGFGMVHQF